MNWDVFKCPMCGGDAPMAVMSLVARCIDCGSNNTDTDGRGHPTKWVMPCAQGAD
jgi:hypothetical protein